MKKNITTSSDTAGHSVSEYISRNHTYLRRQNARAGHSSQPQALTATLGISPSMLQEERYMLLLRSRPTTSMSHMEYMETQRARTMTTTSSYATGSTIFRRRYINFSSAQETRHTEYRTWLTIKLQESCILLCIKAKSHNIPTMTCLLWI